MRGTPLLLTVALGAVGCDGPAPRASSSAIAVPDPPAAVERERSVRNPALSGVVRREIEGHGAERYEIDASATEPRSDFVGIVNVERRDAAPFAARLALKEFVHDAAPWTVRVEISRFDRDVALPALKIGETVEIVPIVRISWLDDRPPRGGASDVAPRSR